MEYVVKPFMLPFEFYEWMMSKSDPRTRNLPLCGSPFPLLFILFCYLYFVKVLGPQWMKNRPPFRIEKLVAFHDFLMAVISVFFFLYGGSYTYLRPWGKYSWFCEPVNYGSDPDTMTLISLSWWYFILRIFCLVDTVFFVLRKKFSQISTLHVIHHTTVAYGIWIGIKYIPGGNGIFPVFINCFIHILVYSYYCLAAFGPRMRKYLWWKKSLTILQMVQFAIAVVHASIPLFYDCGFPKGFTFALAAHLLLYFVLFLNFYRHTYKQKKGASSTLESDSHSSHSDGTTMNGNHQPNGLYPKRRHGTIIHEDHQRESLIHDGAVSMEDHQTRTDS